MAKNYRVSNWLDTQFFGHCSIIMNVQQLVLQKVNFYCGCCHLIPKSDFLAFWLVFLVGQETIKQKLNLIEFSPKIWLHLNWSVVSKITSTSIFFYLITHKLCIKWKNSKTLSQLKLSQTDQEEESAMKIMKNENLHTFVHQWILSNHLKLMRKFSLFFML